ncbi:hypothetical protein B6V75_03225 [Thioclava sp. F1Mire-8]|uniref:terminase small subunit n=1 Tax=Thioclava sp. F1Mire-8 TaxID=1973006 RepID=UPI000B53FF1E|nr:terminase small subunit [Thioclava sp. F1Mire-8]OWY05159.1 hypothetical protein B6V75_03225 [Thioclava sp. F1Mire-8]
MPLTPKQAAFCAEYIIDLDATKATIRAGYSERTAGQQGYNLLQREDVKAEVQRLMTERAERTKVTADEVINELAAIMRAKVSEIVGYEPGMTVTDGDVSVKVERFFNWIADCINGVQDFATTYQDYLDVNSFIDTVLFMEFVGDLDGRHNNRLFATHDGTRWSATVYDLDRTFQTGISGSATPGFGIWGLVLANLRDECNARYAELRNNGILSLKTIFDLATALDRKIVDD